MTEASTFYVASWGGQSDALERIAERVLTVATQIARRHLSERRKPGCVMRSVTETTDCVTAVGYVRVSTSDQVGSGAGLEAQRRAIEDACRDRGWGLVAIFEDHGLIGKNLNRTGLQDAIRTVEASTGHALVVAKLDRLSRSLIDFATLMERSRRKVWHMVALDLGVDTSTPQGEMVASVMATFAQFERRLIGLRTKEALAVKRSQGVRLGRPTAVSTKAVRIIEVLRSSGLTFRAIAEQLDEDQIPTPHGGPRWHANSVRRILLSLDSTITDRD